MCHSPHGACTVDLWLSLREREEAIEHWMDAASVSSKGVNAAEAESRKARDSTRRLEAEVKHLSSSLAELATSYRYATSHPPDNWVSSNASLQALCCGSQHACRGQVVKGHFSTLAGLAIYI